MKNENEQFETPKFGTEGIVKEKFIPNPDEPQRVFNERGVVEWGGKIIADVQWELEHATEERKKALQDVTEEFPPATVEKYMPVFDAQLKQIDEKREELTIETKKTITRIMNGDVPV
ncbi:MAG: hypothetical protein COZ27_00195 [Candidatus Moranbacteria bacterium CG_4_10_14_3_um_filter_41_65]|nr:MAG: hypothetical protein COX32_01740 [Candidatus Moranbacteria bacterium CG23_combo_of_CG06-09_8_20_14_all_41_28]PIV86444.1 MAG: hypothetical protein COW50_01360 [Candidatus Moranbacteria bacterium CG17_big_fil_post_rev_8_21_14_2_50_41_107]PIW94130.1 MAG: hypothetical protein COZ86_02700 [Candidatus Moranbacteria bacterium CG_4_8_14_3_um_filter_41_13]PIX91924.1 MAG: hypothetical protein COZ27_00195 [Candidatus Moranbacteria bacterium CG_4_10_14_3_um_filter_41_65]HCJ45327.1 hypothetical prot